MPFFSIITINLNNKHGLANTIASVSVQSFRDFEYIVIDGMSEDGSLDIIAENASEINAWKSEKDKGVYDAMNKGLEIATGEYIQFLNSGDEFASADTLRRIHSDCSGADLVYCDVIVFGGKEEWIKRHPDHLGTRYLLTDMVCHQAIFARTSLFSRTGKFEISYKVYGDYAWLLHALRIQNAAAVHVAETLVRYEEFGISTAASKQLQRMEKDKIQDKYFGRLLLWIYRLYRKLNDRTM